MSEDVRNAKGVIIGTIRKLTVDEWAATHRPSGASYSLIDTREDAIELIYSVHKTWVITNRHKLRRLQQEMERYME